MNRIVWTFGLIAGVMMSAMLLVTIPLADRIGQERGMIVGYTTMVLSFLLVYFGVRSYRDGAGGGRIGFARAFGVGMMIVLVASLCYVATWELLYFKIAPDYQQKFAASAIERARASAATPAEAERKVAEARAFMESYQNPLVNAAITLIEPLPVGLVMALVSAGLLSRRRREEGADLAAAAAT